MLKLPTILKYSFKMKVFWRALSQFALRFCPEHKLIMALIAQPRSQDACGIGSHPLVALGWAKGSFGSDFVEL